MFVRDINNFIYTEKRSWCVRACVRACVCVCVRETDRQTDRQTDRDRSKATPGRSVLSDTSCCDLCESYFRLLFGYRFGFRRFSGKNPVSLGLGTDPSFICELTFLVLHSLC